MNQEQLIKEIRFKAIRSSGSGGQHVNKVSTKVESQFTISESLAFSYEEKETLLTALAAKLNKEGALVLQCGETRSQYRNKEILKQRLIALFKFHLRPKKIRKKTKIPHSVKMKRLQSKRRNADKKVNRRKPDLD